MKAGLNLFSLRTFLGTESEFLNTALRLKELGYSYMQFSGGPYDPDKIARVTKESGMPVVLTHVPFTRILNDTEALMEEHSRFDCYNIGLGAMSQLIITNENSFKENVEKLNAAAELMNQNGFSFFYHNHHYEFFRHGDKTAFDYMIENAPYINFTVDTYWMQFGGVSVIDYLNKLKGRIKCVHLKDYRIDKPLGDSDGGLAPRFAPVGDGTLDFKRIIETMKRMGTEYFLVEQDNAPEFPDPFEQVGRSINYLKREF